MTTSELIAKLDLYPPNTPIFGWDYDLQTLGDIVLTEVAWVYTTSTKLTVILGLAHETPETSAGAYSK